MSTRHEKLTWMRAALDSGAEECVIWPFTRNAAGYSDGTLIARNNAIRPNMLMCEWKNGPKPFARAVVRHSCNNGHLGCINPNHLAWGSSHDNAIDMVKSGRSRLGKAGRYWRVQSSNSAKA